MTLTWPYWRPGTVDLVILVSVGQSFGSSAFAMKSLWESLKTKRGGTVNMLKIKTKMKIN